MRCWAHALLYLLLQTASGCSSLTFYIPPLIPMSSCPSPAMSCSAYPACGKTSSGPKLAASLPYEDKSLLSANLAFSASSSQGLKSPGLPLGRTCRWRHRREMGGSFDAHYESKIVIQTISGEAQLHCAATQKPLLWRITLVFAGSVSSGWASDKVCPTDAPTPMLARNALGRGWGSNQGLC